MVCMQSRWVCRLVPLILLLACLSPRPWIAEVSGHGAELAAGQGATEAPTSGLKSTADRTAPTKAYDLLSQLRKRDGAPLPGYVGGREFQNRERRLPRGRYREYDVNPKLPGKSRDAERLVIEQRTGKAYYTGDHYRTFIPLEGP